MTFLLPTGWSVIKDLCFTIMYWQRVTTLLLNYTSSRFTCMVKAFLVPAAITCDDIPDPENGQITHVPDTHAPFEFGNEALYSCYVDGENRIGFGLTGGNHTRTCTGDGTSPTGYWTGTAPTCERELYLLLQANEIAVMA